MITGTRYRLTAEINRQAALAREIARAQVEISTEKKILAPSDDPVAAARIAEIARQQASETAWSQNLKVAATLASRADTALDSVEAIMGRAQELILEAASDTLSEENRATIAAELRGIAEDLAALVETRDSRGALLFSDANALKIPVGSAVEVAPVASRADVFENIDTPSGPLDLVTIITNAANAVTEADPALRRTAIAESIEAVNAGTHHMIAAHGEQGVRASRIDDLSERLAESGLLLKEQRIGLESADIAEVIARLQAKELSLKAAQAVFARVNQNTLFDILR